MAFQLDDMLIDRIIMATAEDFQGNVLYTLTQLQNASINITAESNDVTDRDGTVIKRFWRGKTGEFTAENALINLNIIAAESGPVGEAKQFASAGSPIVVPGLKVAKASDGTTVTLTNATGTPRVYGLFTNGTLGDEFQTGGSASASAFAYDDTTKVLTIPVSNDYTQYLIRYDRSQTENTVVIRNKADKFPGTVRLILKVLYVDPCSADTVRCAYIELPSFQVSPEAEITVGSDSQTINYSGQLQVNYCSENKELYNIYAIEDDYED